MKVNQKIDTAINLHYGTIVTSCFFFIPIIDFVGLRDNLLLSNTLRDEDQ